MTFHIITLFPESFTSYLNESILARAQESKLIKFKFYNPRDFAKPTEASRMRAKNGKGEEKPYLRVDDKPYGGGPGMILQALPVIKAIERALKEIKKEKLKIKKENSKDYKLSAKSYKLIHLSPAGEKFTNAYAEKVSKKYDHIIIVCGRYEGIDARVKKIFKGDEISIGDYVLTGGELPAMVMIDSISRQIEGVLGNAKSVEEKRIASHDTYTRPEILEYKGKKHKIPKVLKSGNHAEIEKWRAGK
ncbi:MAG: tRNA (guanosine(37)-N1)-methyltransferase TrmD [bacterium]